METLHFILACYGMTFILVYGKIFEDLRPKKDYTKKWNKVLTDPVWIEFKKRMEKYRPFVNFDPKKGKEILRKVFL